MRLLLVRVNVDSDNVGFNVDNICVFNVGWNVDDIHGVNISGLLPTFRSLP